MVEPSGCRRAEGKVVVITGASGELARVATKLLVEHGAQVACIDLKEHEDLARVGIAGFYRADVSSAVEVSTAIEQIVDRHGSPDVLVNAAGLIGPSKPAHEITEEEFDRLFAVNVKGTWLPTKYVVPSMMREGRGSIINFSSIYGLRGGGSVPIYHATKGAVRLMTKADAATYGEYGIRVNSIHPGSINTAMSRQAAETSPLGPDEYYRRLFGSNPLPRQGEPIEIAYGVLYLASDESVFTTGSELVIDGGFSAV